MPTALLGQTGELSSSSSLYVGLTFRFRNQLYTLDSEIGPNSCNWSEISLIRGLLGVPSHSEKNASNACACSPNSQGTVYIRLKEWYTSACRIQLAVFSSTSPAFVLRVSHPHSWNGQRYITVSVLILACKRTGAHRYNITVQTV